MFDGSRNRFQNTLEVGHDIMIVEAQNAKALAGEKGI
jgi:hypothetical protein